MPWLDLLPCSNWQSIQVMTRLEELDLSDCLELQSLPDTLGLLSRLQRLDVNDCASLEKLPSTLGQLTDLRHVNHAVQGGQRLWFKFCQTR